MLKSILGWAMLLVLVFGTVFLAEMNNEDWTMIGLFIMSFIGAIAFINKAIDLIVTEQMADDEKPVTADETEVVGQGQL